VIDSHKQEDIIEVLKQQPLQLREQVEEVSVDMWGGFPKVVQEVVISQRKKWGLLRTPSSASEIVHY